MPNLCKICTYPDQEAVRVAFAANVTDRALAQRFGVSAMSISRHRRAHLVAPLRAAVAALDRGRAHQEQRAKQRAAIAQADPVAITEAIGMSAQVAKLIAIEQRLERMAAASETNGSATGVAVLSAQALRGIETGAKLAALPGFVPQRSIEGVSGEAKFAVHIVFSNGVNESISFGQAPPIEHPRLDAGSVRVGPAEFGVPDGGDAEAQDADEPVMPDRGPTGLFDAGFWASAADPGAPVDPPARRTPGRPKGSAGSRGSPAAKHTDPDNLAGVLEDLLE